jgi:alanine racemase
MRAPKVAIDLGALRHNFRRVREIAPRSRIMAVVKADAYGHGLLRVAQALPDADAFAVSCVTEGVALREAGVRQAIVALHGFRDSHELKLASIHEIDLTLHQQHQLRMLGETELPKPLRIWIKLDTGMHRLGFAPALAGEILASLQGLKQVRGTSGMMTHLACADEPGSTATREQLKSFDDSLTSLAAEQSIANSAGILAWADSHRDWVRPGLMLYGCSPFPGRCGEQEGLRPVMSLKAPVVAVSHRRKGEPIGYGGGWRCPADLWIAAVAVGYGDGYPRHAVSGTPVLINGRRCAIAGRVSMDLLTVDLGQTPGASPGDEAMLWGSDLPVETIADRASTICYELLCVVGAKVRREFVSPLTDTAETADKAS